MIDMFTTILIFLIINFAPDESRVQKTEKTLPPKSAAQMKAIPKIQIEVTETSIRLNGKAIEGLTPMSEDIQVWNILKDELKKINEKAEPVLLIADQDSNYGIVDSTIGHLAAQGYGEVYLLTRREDKKENLQ